MYKEQAGDANFKVADVPKGREVSSDFVANALASTLSALHADDVYPAKDMPPGDKVYKADYVAFDGSNKIAITAEIHDLDAAKQLFASPPPDVAATMQEHGVVPPITAYVEAP